MQTKTMEEIITELAPKHFGYIKELYSFPMECVWSSHIVGAFLQQTGLATEVKYGTYGPHHLFHSWLEIGEKILDFTLFQFLTNKEKRSFYQKMSGEEVTEYALYNQGAFIIDKTNPYFHLYETVATMKHQFLDEFELTKTDDYSSFYESVWNKKGYFQYGILDAVAKGDGRTFEEILKKANLQFGKKFFTKKCIIEIK